MERSKFETIVQEGFAQLPASVREKIKNVAVLVADEPPLAVRQQERLRNGETLLGYYQGIPLASREYGASMILPDTITLYRKPIEQMAREDSMEIRDVIADTIWHEFAHHFGMDEEAVRKREDKRRT